jgi:hypothetical protein
MLTFHLCGEPPPSQPFVTILGKFGGVADFVTICLGFFSVGA